MIELIELSDPFYGVHVLKLWPLSRWSVRKRMEDLGQFAPAVFIQLITVKLDTTSNQLLPHLCLFVWETFKMVNEQ